MAMHSMYEQLLLSYTTIRGCKLMAIHSMHEQLLHLTVHTYCALPLTYSLDLLFNVKCWSCSCILCIAMNLQPRLSRACKLMAIHSMDEQLLHLTFNNKSRL
jgi:hypothetical protein